MNLRKHYSTIGLFDIHLDSEDSKIKEVTYFLKHVNYKQFILNGDIIDGWQLHMPFILSNISIVPDYTFISAADKRTNWLCLPKKKKCESIIYGHIHQATNEYYNGIHYLNSGDWVESLTALVEDEQGSWSVVTYTEGLSVKSRPDSTLQKPFETHRSTTICFEINIHNNLLKLKQL